VTLLILLAIVNLVTWAAYRWDKLQAGRRGQRVPERTLLRLAWYGGWIGAPVGIYGPRARHKASKVAFLRLLWLAVVSWVLGVAVVATWIMLSI
jgi:uncharacterized membrane protein YsdA (DUF1294 family)